MSSHLRSLERRNLVLGILAVALALVLFFRPETVTSVDKEALPLLFPEFEKEGVRRVTLVQDPSADEPKKLEISLMAGGGMWVLSSHHGYPTQAGADALLDAIASARVRSEVTRRTETFDKYAGNDGWVQVELVDTRGKQVLAFALGRYAYPESFVRIGTGEEQRIVKVLNLAPSHARVEARSWIETRIWPELTASDTIRLDVEQRRDERTITLLKRGEPEADLGMAGPAKSEDEERAWWMAAPQEGDAKSLAVEDLAREFSGMLIDEVAGSGSDDDARFGFDDPELVVTLLSRPQGGQVAKHRLVVGKRVEGQEAWYVRRDGASWVFSVGVGSVNRMRQAPEEFLAPPEEPGDGDGSAKDAKDAKGDGTAKDAKDAKGEEPAKEPKDDGADPKKDDGGEPKKEGGG